MVAVSPYMDQEATFSTLIGLDQQQQAPLDAVTDHSGQHLPGYLPMGPLRNWRQVLALLSGLPAFYYVAFSKAMTTEITGQSAFTEMCLGLLRTQYNLWLNII